MKHGLKRTSGFTLIELLVVIAIIGVLAGILIPTLGAANTKAKKTKATTEINQIVGALNQYQSTYGRYPASKITRTTGIDTAEHPDFTYGTAGVGEPPGDINSYLNRQKKPTQVLNLKGTFQTNNAEIMAILMDVKDWVSKAPGNSENPQHQNLFSPKQVDLKTSPGLGPDGVYRDPWGAPYIISLDLNYDGQTRDAFYRGAAVTSPTPNKPLNGLFLVPNSTPPAYEARHGVMVWSLGPDGEASASVGANEGVNKDNVLSWK